MSEEEVLIGKILSGVYRHLEKIVPFAIKNAIEEAFQERTEEQSTKYEDNLDSIQAASYLKIKITTLYSKVENGELPFTRVGKRKLLFKKEELEQFLLKRKVKSKDEIDDEVENYINDKK